MIATNICSDFGGFRYGSPLMLAIEPLPIHIVILFLDIYSSVYPRVSLGISSSGTGYFY